MRTSSSTTEMAANTTEYDAHFEAQIKGLRKNRRLLVMRRLDTRLSRARLEAILRSKVDPQYEFAFLWPRNPSTGPPRNFVYLAFGPNKHASGAYENLVERLRGKNMKVERAKQYQVSSCLVSSYQTFNSCDSIPHPGPLPSPGRCRSL